MNGTKEETKRYFEKNKNKNTMTPKSMGKSQTSSKREIQSYISLPQETRKISNKKYHLTLKLGEISEWKKESNKY